MIQRMLAIWSLVPLPFLNPAWTSGNSQFTYSWSLAWRILSITLLACEMSAIVQSSNFIIIILGMLFVVKKIRGQTAACGLHRLCFNIRLQRSNFSLTGRQELSQIEQIFVGASKVDSSLLFHCVLVTCFNFYCRPSVWPPRKTYHFSYHAQIW